MKLIFNNITNTTMIPKDLMRYLTDLGELAMDFMGFLFTIVGFLVFQYFAYLLAFYA